jgi:hypothetical protein
MLPFGEMVENLRKISWICNLFAVPRTDAAVCWWATVSGQVRERLAMRPKKSFNEQWLVRAMSSDPCSLVNA